MEIEALRKRNFVFDDIFLKWNKELPNGNSISIRDMNDKRIVRIVDQTRNSIVVPRCKTIRDLDQLINLFR